LNLVRDGAQLWFGLQVVPPGEPFPNEHWEKKVCVLVVSHTGRTTDAEKAVNAVRAALPRPIIDWAQPMPYPMLQSLFDALYPKGLQWYWKGDFVKTLPDEAIEAHLAHAAKLPTVFSAMHLYPIDGAVHRPEKDATAWNCRDATWSMVIFGVDPDPTKAPALKKWTRDYWEAVHPFDRAGAYPNFMMDDEGDARVKAAYGENYDTLATLKKKYDPANLFRVNQNIRPGALSHRGDGRATGDLRHIATLANTRFFKAMLGMFRDGADSALRDVDALIEIATSSGGHVSHRGIDLRRMGARDLDLVASNGGWKGEKEGDRSAQHCRLRDVEDRAQTILPQVLACPIQSSRSSSALFTKAHHLIMSLFRGPLAAVEISRNERHSHEVGNVARLHLLNDSGPVVFGRLELMRN
jgi:hypothetical protein